MILKDNTRTTIKEYLERFGKIEYGIQGSSMYPLLKESNDTVYIEYRDYSDKERALREGDIVLYERNGKNVLHRIIEIVSDGDEKKYIIRGDNCKYAEEIENDRIFGIMVRLSHNGRVIDATDSEYQRLATRMINIDPNKQKKRVDWNLYYLKLKKYLSKEEKSLFKNGQYLYNVGSADIILEQLSHSHKKNTKPYLLKVDNGIVLPRKRFHGRNSIVDRGGVLTESLDYVEESREYDFGGAYVINEDEIETIDETVIYLGRAFPHYGVVMIDLLRRLYFRFTEEGKGLKVCFCGVNCEPGTFGKSNARSWELLGLLKIAPEDVIDVRKPTRFKTIYVPEPGFEYMESYHDEFYYPYKYLFDKAEANVKDPEKVYLSRKKMGNIKEVGEEIIERFFVKNGYSVMCPDELSIMEQISILKGAKCIASVEGTISHNILFCNPGTEQIVIRKYTRIEPRHFLFNELMDSPVTYIDCFFNFMPGFPRHYDIGPFCMIFNRNIRRFAKDKGYSLPSCWYFENIRTILRYVGMCAKQASSERKARKNSE